MSFALGCVAHQVALLDMLAVARRCALPQFERVLSDFDGVIESSVGIIDREHTLAESPSLVEAKEAATTSRRKLRRLEEKVRTLEAQLSALPRPTWWRRLLFRAESSRRSALSAELAKTQAQAVIADAVDSRARGSLAEEERLYKLAQRDHVVQRSNVVEVAKQASLTAQAAKALVLKRPELAGLGSDRLLEMAAQIEQVRWDAENEETPQHSVYALGA